MVELTEDNLISSLMSLKDEQDKNYIKEGWFDGIDMKNLFKDNENKYKTSIIDCINNCTSPSPNKKDFENKEEDFIKEKLKLIFKAFSLFEPSETKVLILGQDPYPEVKRAQGLAFSFKNNHKPADDSLLNIFKAIEEYKKKNNINITKSIKEWDTNLECWAKNNDILLLNTALTFDEKTSLTKRKNVWEPFVQKIITKLLTYDNDNLVIFLWGKEAQKTFLRVLNNIEYKAKIEKQIKPKNNKKDIVYKNNQEKLKINNELIRSIIAINNSIKLFMTSHPSNNYNSVKKGFEQDAPNYFKACDDFLDKNIWKNFPKNIK